MTSKRILATLALIAATILAATAPRLARAQDLRDFRFVNDTGRQIDYLYVSPHERRYWGRDVLGNGYHDVLPDGTATTIVFPPDWQTSCSMDFKLVFHDRSEQTYTDGRNVCRLNGVVFHPVWSEGF